MMTGVGIRACPHLELYTEGPGGYTLFYGDYYSDCDTSEIEATYLWLPYETAPIPYENCNLPPNGSCQVGTRGPCEAAKWTDGCRSLGYYVGEVYDHPGDKDSDPNYYIWFRDDANNIRWGKVLKFTTPAGVRYVAFEMDPAEPNPESQTGRKIRQLKFRKKTKPEECNYIHRAKTKIESHEVLIWLNKAM